MESRLQFSMRGVPENWINKHPGYGGQGQGARAAYFAMMERYRDWRDSAIILGSQARVAAGWSHAEKDSPRRIVQIHQKRHGELDEDGLATSVKPIVDGMKSWLYRKRRDKPTTGEMEKYEGAAIYWDDKPIYCHLLEPTQEVVARSQDPLTIITISLE